MTFSAPTNALESVPPYGDTERKGVDREGEAEADALSPDRYELKPTCE